MLTPTHAVRYHTATLLRPHAASRTSHQISSPLRARPQYLYWISNRFHWFYHRSTAIGYLGPTRILTAPTYDCMTTINRPAKQDAIFVSLIVTMPVIQIFAMIFGITHIVLEYLPAIRKMSIYRSFALRIVTYSLQTFLSILHYQASLCYLRFTPSLTCYRAQTGQSTRL